MMSGHRHHNATVKLFCWRNMRKPCYRPDLVCTVHELPRVAESAVFEAYGVLCLSRIGTLGSPVGNSAILGNSHSTGIPGVGKLTDNPRLFPVAAGWLRLLRSIRGLATSRPSGSPSDCHSDGAL